MGVVGNLSIDRIAGSPPRIGGGPYHAARAIRLLAVRGDLFVRCADADRRFLVRRPEQGPLQLDAEFDRELLRYVTVLKLAEEEAELVGDVDVPELVITLGSRGALLRAGGRETRVTTRPLERDPTGAGDAFAAAYVVSRAAGHPPAAAARRATAIVGAALR